MTIRQSRYILAETDQERRVRVTGVQRAEEDPVLRRSDIQQQVSNSTLPASSRAVNLAIESVNSNLNLKADKSELEGLATEDYVNEKIDEKEVGITEPELVSKSVGAGKWMREGAYGLGGVALSEESDISNIGRSGIYKAFYKSPSFEYGHFLHMQYSGAFYTQIGVKSVAVSPPRVIFNHKGRGGELSSGEFYTDINTFPDSNGVLHNSSSPIDTLNTSDMADTVVDNDLLTVTSGAVFRAIKQLTDQITNLEARVRELEDGGV